MRQILGDGKGGWASLLPQILFEFLGIPLLSWYTIQVFLYEQKLRKKQRLLNDFIKYK